MTLLLLLTLSSHLPDELKVPQGQLTFDAEGTEGGRFHSRKPSVPSNSSGVTIGRGFEMKERTAVMVKAHLTQVGLEAAVAEAYSKGAGLHGTQAKAFLTANNLPEITLAQQKALFVISYDEAARDVERICNKSDVVAKYGATRWNDLHPAIRELLVDLRFRGDYTPKSREILQKHVSDKNLRNFVAEIIILGNWRSVPEDRFLRRKAYAEKALTP